MTYAGFPTEIHVVTGDLYGEGRLYNVVCTSDVQSISGGTTAYCCGIVYVYPKPSTFTTLWVCIVMVYSACGNLFPLSYNIISLWNVLFSKVRRVQSGQIRSVPSSIPDEYTIFYWKLEIDPSATFVLRPLGEFRNLTLLLLVISSTSIKF